MPEKARLFPAGFSTTKTGLLGPMAEAIGSAVAWSLAASSCTSPAATMVSAASRFGAQPSAITAARTERRNGSQKSPHSSSGPQWRIVRSPTPGTTSRMLAIPVSCGRASSMRRSTSVLAVSIRSDHRP